MRPITTTEEKSRFIAQIIVMTWWPLNKERVEEWMKSEHQVKDDTPQFETFMEEFAYNCGYDDPSMSEMLNHQLDHFEEAGYDVASKVTSDLEMCFGELLDDVMAEMAVAEQEQEESYFEFREVV